MKKEGGWGFKAFPPQDKCYAEYFWGDSCEPKGNPEFDLEMDSESTEMTDDIRRDIWHQLLEQKSKTISLEDEFREESLPRCKQKYIKCGYVFICLKHVCTTFPFLEKGSRGRRKKGAPGKNAGEGKSRERPVKTLLQITPEALLEVWRPSGRVP